MTDGTGAESFPWDVEDAEARRAAASRWFTVEPPVLFRPPGHPWDLEARVALPRSYHESDRAYPVLWVTDNALDEALPALGERDLIVVGIGAPYNKPATDGYPGRGYHAGRNFDFFADSDHLPLSPYREFIQARVGDNDVRNPGGGGYQFLDFLIDELRPTLTSRYRMDPTDHALEGYSGGGYFVVFAMLARPGAFSKYIAGAPALYYMRGLVFELEQRHSETHGDLPASLYMGIGDGEITMAPDAMFGCLSSTARLAEILTCREYSSLKMTVRFFPGKGHWTVRSEVIDDAARTLWGARTPDDGRQGLDSA